MIERMLAEILGERAPAELAHVGAGSLPSAFPVSDLASASVAGVALAVSDLLAFTGEARRAVTVDRRLASMWFGSSLRPIGWSVPPPWDAVAGDYRAADGWIRLHTNAPAHREAALGVLGVEADRARVAVAVETWTADALEAAVIAAGGCAATMHTAEAWASSEPSRSVASEPLVRWEDLGESTPSRVSRADPARPLAGVRVLDLTRVLAGPVATRTLAQLGADVLRIDPPWWDEPGVVPDVMLGKRSARLDLRVAEHRIRLLELLASADILVHGYRPGALDSLGLGAAVRREAAPGLIEVTLDAYGWSGPWAARRGFDSLVQMSTGIAEAGMRWAGRETPTPLPVQALDHATGYLMARAVIMALTERMRTGRVQRASLSLARTALLLTGGGAHPDRSADLSIAGAHPLRAEDDDDLSTSVEHTSWGPARRLRSPMAIDGVDLSAVGPARALGSDRAEWLA